MTIDQLIERYVEVGVAQDDVLWNGPRAKFRQLFDEMCAIEKELASRGLEARRSLMSLYRHPNLQVRLNAAKGTLAVAPEEARRVIQAIADSKLYPQAGDAGMCLWALDEAISKPE